MKVKLEECLARFLDREAKDDSERTEWIKALPFPEHPTQTSMRRYRPTPHALYHTVYFWQGTTKPSASEPEMH